MASARRGVEVDNAELIRLRATARGLSLRPPRRRRRVAQSGPQTSRLRGRGVDYLETRGYQPGDDIRSMDWRVTARTGKPHTKIYQEERERPVVLVLDANPSMFFGSRGAFKSVTAARAAALLGWAAVDGGDRVGAFFFGAERTPDDDRSDAEPFNHLELAPAGGRRGALRLIQQLVRWSRPQPAVMTAPTPGRLDDALRRLRRVARPGSLVFLISDFYACGEDCERSLAQLRRHSDVVALQISDVLEHQPPPPGRYAIVADGQRRLLDTRSAQTAAHYSAYFTAHHRRVERLLSGQHIPLLGLRSDDEPLGALRRGLETIR